MDFRENASKKRISIVSDPYQIAPCDNGDSFRKVGQNFSMDDSVSLTLGRRMGYAQRCVKPPVKEHKIPVFHCHLSHPMTPVAN